MADKAYQVLRAYGFNSIQRISYGGDWNMWLATSEIPTGEKIERFYLYLTVPCPMGRATEDNIEKWTHSSNEKGYSLLLPISNKALTADIERTRQAFRADRAFTTREFLLDRFQRLQEGTGWREISAEPHFIDPDLAFFDGPLLQENDGQETLDVINSVPNATSYMMEWLRGEKKGRNENACIAVLIADGGVGKTTLAHMLCRKIHDEAKNTYPIFIEPDQWQRKVETYPYSLTMDKIWEGAIRQRTSDPKDSAKRRNLLDFLTDKAALEGLVREGLFVVVFDGFDELCIRPEGGLTPAQIIEDLDKLINPDEDEDMVPARIILTSRKTFWESIKDNLSKSRLETFRVKGFSNEKMQRYFENRFDGSDQGEKRDLALRLASQIGGGIYEAVPTEGQNEDRLSGLPFILDIIARLLEENITPEFKEDIENFPGKPIRPYMTDPFEPLLRFVFKRENERQNLGMSPEQQFEIFEDIFVSYPDGVSAEGLFVIVGDVLYPKEHSLDEGLEEITQRFTNHRLLTSLKTNGTLQYKSCYEVIKVYFLARFLSFTLTRDVSTPETRRKVIKLFAESSSGGTQSLDLLKRQLQQFQENQLLEAIKHARRIIEEEEDGEEKRDSGKALFHLIQQFVPQDAGKSERTSRLAQFLETLPRQGEGSTFSNIIITGELKAYDMTNIHFFQCQLVDVTFTNCDFSPQSKFTRCRFEGTLMFSNCSNIKEIKRINISLSLEAKAEFSRILGDKLKTDEKQIFAQDVLKRALNKFMGPYGFIRISPQEEDLRMGLKPGNPCNEKVWAVLKESGVVEDCSFSHGAPALCIPEDEDVRGAVNYFFQNGIPSGRLQEVYNSLIAS